MTSLLSQSLLISVKDMRIFAANRFALAFSFLFPFLFIIGFTFALRGVGPEDEPLRFVLASQDEGPIAGQIVAGLTADPDGRFIEMSHRDATRDLDAGEIAGFVAFPAGFSQSMFTGQPTALQVRSQAEDPENAAALVGIASSLARQINLNGVVIEAAASLASDAGLDPAALDMSSIRQVTGAVRFETQQVGDVEPFDSSTITVPGYLVMFVFFAAAMGAQSLVQERENHTLERMASNGVRREAIILGTLLSSAYLGLMQLAILWIVGVLAFGLDLGVSPAAVIGISVLMVAASSAFSVMLASLMKTRRSIDSAGVLISIMLAAIGGCWWPLFIMPTWLQALAKATPHGWANQAFNKLLVFGAGGADIGAEVIALALFTAGFLAIALWRFRTAPVQ